MTIRQNILRIVYPFWLPLAKALAKEGVLENKQRVKPVRSFYDLSVTLNNGAPLSFEALKGKKVLLVNTASDCGYTPQYAQLQKLFEQNNDKLIVIGFPANDFKEQEPGSDTDIARFCRINYGVTFPLVQKSSVVKSPEQHPVFAWLSHREQNGWNEQAPVWNFSKYLVDENGVLTHYFAPTVAPDASIVLKTLSTK